MTTFYSHDLRRRALRGFLEDYKTMIKNEGGKILKDTGVVTEGDYPYAQLEIKTLYGPHYTIDFCTDLSAAHGPLSIWYINSMREGMAVEIPPINALIIKWNDQLKKWSEEESLKVPKISS